MKEILSSDQIAAYQGYAHEESLLAKAKETRKLIAQKTDALRKEFEK
jgi:hypothetical protein